MVINIDKLLNKYLKLCCDIKKKAFEDMNEDMAQQILSGTERNPGPLRRKHRMVQDWEKRNSNYELASVNY